MPLRIAKGWRLKAQKPDCRLKTQNPDRRLKTQNPDCQGGEPHKR
jgi:hypothetical protein